MMRVRALSDRFSIALVCLWALLGTAGLAYARILDLPLRAALPLIAALLVEISLYAVPAFPEILKRIPERFSAPAIATALVASTLVPYLVYSLASGQFHWSAVAILAALATVVSFWFIRIPGSAASDFAFLAFMAAVMIVKPFRDLYPDPAPGLRIDILGQLMWIRLGVAAMLLIRRIEGVGFGFIPDGKDLGVGFRYYACFIPIGLPLALLLGVVKFRPIPLEWWKAAPLAVATFLGMLWVVALSEEFFFRGVLQRHLSRLLSSELGAILIAAALFGLVHLPFRQFPNWKFSLVAAVAGFFYGKAFTRAGSIRAAMVAHALVNTTMRMLFA
ncbi:MAG: CPBP family intramembrane glutamic endopeptidase [Bryobacteraceae bacterium]